MKPKKTLGQKCQANWWPGFQQPEKRNQLWFLVVIPHCWHADCSETSNDPNRTPMSEDCLFINVLTNRKCLIEGGCAVIFYIHGGGYRYDTPSLFSPQFLVYLLIALQNTAFLAFEIDRLFDVSWRVFNWNVFRIQLYFCSSFLQKNTIHFCRHQFVQYLCILHISVCKIYYILIMHIVALNSAYCSLHSFAYCAILCN